MSKWYSILSKYILNGYFTAGSQYTSATAKYLPYEYTYDGVTYNRYNLPISRAVKFKLLPADIGTEEPRIIEVSTGSVKFMAYNAERGRCRVCVDYDESGTFNSEYFTELETTQISGKFRIRETIQSAIPDLLRQGTIPVQFTLNGVQYKNFVFNDTSSLYSTNTGTFGRNNRYAVSVYSNPIDFSQGYDYVDPTYLTLMKNPTTSHDNVVATDLVDGIIDFGSGQEVPVLFYDWMQTAFDPIYPYKYTVMSNDGQTKLAEITEAPPMTNAYLSFVGNRKTLILTGVNNKEYTLEWESTTPEGKRFNGLADRAASSGILIPVNATTAVTFTESTVLYESYGTYRPANSFDVELYNSDAEVNRVDKTDYLTPYGTLSGTLREESSMIRPTITFQSSSVPGFNYVYIPAFGRYYYVNNIVSVNKNLWRMELNCDVLMTYRTQIRRCGGMVTRSASLIDSGVVDDEVAFDTETQYKKIDLGEIMYQHPETEGWSSLFINSAVTVEAPYITLNVVS